MVEDSISQGERDRSKALEAIIIFDSLAKARQSQEEIMQQIQELH